MSEFHFAGPEFSAFCCLPALSEYMDALFLPALSTDILDAFARTSMSCGLCEQELPAEHMKCVAPCVWMQRRELCILPIVFS
jgi:hypothetical protein